MAAARRAMTRAMTAVPRVATAVATASMFLLWMLTSRHGKGRGRSVPAATANSDVTTPGQLLIDGACSGVGRDLTHADRHAHDASGDRPTTSTAAADRRDSTTADIAACIGRSERTTHRRVAG
jgi:hypothetical protein